MAKIVLSDTAPSDETLTFSLAGATEPFQVPYESDNRELLTNAEAHPWLQVEREEVDAPQGTFLDTQLRPEDDHLNAVNDHSNDPDAVAADLEKRKEEISLLAVRPTIDQDEAVKEGPVALTLAADETHEVTPEERNY